ncbi:hypothetical protein GCM10027089_41450 [Nocardia thraciensis]
MDTLRAYAGLVGYAPREAVQLLGRATPEVGGGHREGPIEYRQNWLVNAADPESLWCVGGKLNRVTQANTVGMCLCGVLRPHESTDRHVEAPDLASGVEETVGQVWTPLPTQLAEPRYIGAEQIGEASIAGVQLRPEQCCVRHAGLSKCMDCRAAGVIRVTGPICNRPLVAADSTISDLALRHHTVRAGGQAAVGADADARCAVRPLTGPKHLPGLLPYHR